MAVVIGEVIETGELSYDVNPKSEDDKILPLGSVRVKPLTDSGTGNIDIVYARPLTLNFNFTPMNGELIAMITAPSVDTVKSNSKHEVFYYLPFPVNSTDDVVINQVPNATQRTTKKEQPNITLENPSKPGRTFQFPCRPIAPLQPYEGDLIIQNRSGSSLRLGTGTSNNKQYHKKPKHHKDTKKGDPTFAMTLERPSPPKPRPGVEIPREVSGNKTQGDKSKSQTFRTEDLATNLTGIFGGISQKFSNVKMGRARRFETKRIPSFNKPQILLDTSRIVLNAKRDNLFLIAKDKVILEGRKFLISTDEHHVDFDDLVNRVQDLARELHRLTSAQAFYSTPFGPTGPASNLAQVLRIHLLCQRFHILPPLSLIPPAFLPATNYDFGVNSVKPVVKNRKLKKALSSSANSPASSGAPQEAIDGPLNNPTNIGGIKLQGGGSSVPKSVDNEIREDNLNLLNQNSSQNTTQNYNPQNISDLPNISGPTGLPQIGCGIPCDANGNPINLEGAGLTDMNGFESNIPDPNSAVSSSNDQSKEDSITLNDNSKDNIGFIYNFICDKFDNQSGVTKKEEKQIALFVGEQNKGWYEVLNTSEDEDGYVIGDISLLTKDVMADNDCIKRNILEKTCSEGTILNNVSITRSESLIKIN